MNKKTIIIISVVSGILLLLGCGIFGFKIMKNTKEAENAAANFATILREGDLTKLKLEYYTYLEEESQLVYDENGQAQVRILSKQQLADKYGTDVLRIVEGEEENNPNDALLQTIMKYSIVRTSVKTTFGDTSSMALYMEIPDIKNWIMGLTMRDLEGLAAMTDGHLEDLEARMKSGEISRQAMQFRVPMKKQNGKWRFDITEEIEKTFFGGLYNLFETEEVEAVPSTEKE